MKIIGIVRNSRFKKQFRKLPLDIQNSFETRIKLFLENASNTLLNNHPLHGSLRGYWSINVSGNIRAVYTPQGNIAILVEIGTHSELYDK